jgi:hypothetical protein
MKLNVPNATLGLSDKQMKQLREKLQSTFVEFIKGIKSQAATPTKIKTVRKNVQKQKMKQKVVHAPKPRR